MGAATLLLTSSSLRSPSSFPSPKTNPLRFSPKTLKTSPMSKTLIRAESNQALKSPPSSSSSFSSAGSSSGADLVKQFYSGINRHDLVSVEDLISENCVYEDLIFSKPFVGRKAILEFFKKFTDSISTDLQFVIDDISNEDSSAIGVTWHLEWKGRPFPFSKGCSFYRLEAFNGKKQIVYGRDSVEPATKPGEIALVYLTYCRNSWTHESNDDNPMTDC